MAALISDIGDDFDKSCRRDGACVSRRPWVSSDSRMCRID